MKSNVNQKLSPRQIQVLPHILSSPSYEEAARRSGVSAKQIHEWLKDRDFKLELEKQRNQMTNNAINILKMNTTKAAETLGELLSSSNEAVKRGAANDILHHVRNFQELQELEDRIAVLEEQTKKIS